MVVVKERESVEDVVVVEYSAINKSLSLKLCSARAWKAETEPNLRMLVRARGFKGKP